MSKVHSQVSLIVVLFSLALFFLLPMGAAFEYSIRNGLEGGYSFKNYLWAIREDDFVYYAFRSFWLASLTVVITLIVLVPLLTWLHVTKSRVQGWIDGLSLLPLVIPVVAFAVGAQLALPDVVKNTVLELPFLYFILSLPYAYRALDIGLRAIPLKTLVEAARSSGANWRRTITSVIVPITRMAVLATVALTFALSLGEYTLTVLLHWDTFPTWVTFVAQENLLGAIAISMMTLIVPFLLLAAISLLTPSNKNER